MNGIFNNQGGEKMGKFQDLTNMEFCDCIVLEYMGHSRWKRRCKICNQESIVYTCSIKKHACKCRFINTINETYFENIDSEAKAYFLGFLYADGYVNSKFKTCKIDLQESDVDFLIKFKEATEWSGSINEYVAKAGQSYRPDDAVVKRIHIINQKFSEILESKGVFPHREKEGFPFDKMDSSLFHHFIRGYFDGNGSITVANDKVVNLNICGGTNLLKDIENLLLEDDIHVKHHPRRPENPDNDTLSFTSKKNRDDFLRYMYVDATIYLDRKYNKYLKTIHS